MSTWNPMSSSTTDRYTIKRYNGSIKTYEEMRSLPTVKQRQGDFRDEIPRNRWFWFPDDRPRFVHVRCPGCGNFFSLSIVSEDGNHTINNNGDVNPSIGHGPEGCGFHEWGNLEHWSSPLCKCCGQPCDRVFRQNVMFCHVCTNEESCYETEECSNCSDKNTQSLSFFEWMVSEEFVNEKGDDKNN